MSSVFGETKGRAVHGKEYTKSRIWTYPLAPSSKDNWFPTFVGMVKGRKGNQFGEGEELERGWRLSRYALP